MSWTPTDEQVERAARVVAYKTTNVAEAEPDDMDRDVARAVLVAVGPHIAAQALRDAAGILGADPASPLWDMWDSVAEQYETPVQWLDRRADQIEKEAGR